MGLLTGNEIVGYSESAKQAERCRPDYETMIKSAKDRLEKNTVLRAALYDYLSDKGFLLHQRDNTLSTMIGELELEAKTLQLNIQKLIEEQENNSDR